MDDTMREELIRITQAEFLDISTIIEAPAEGSAVFPMQELLSLGGVLGVFTTAIGEMANSGTGKVLYEAIFPVPGKLAQKDGMFLGAIINENGVAAQARFKEVTNATQAAAGASMMFMALAIVAVNKALKEISENQKAIMSFLETDKQTQLRGDLVVLTDIIEEYQHNWDNEQYRRNREMQVLDIRRSAEQNMLFYREMIEKKLGKKSIVHLDVEKKLNDIQVNLRYYKLALYLYAFSSFLDVMLLENFEDAYLDGVIGRIEQHSQEYEVFYKRVLEYVEEYATSSIHSRALQGLALVGKFAGEQIARIPDKENKLKLDDQLISGGDKLGKLNEDAIGKTIDSFSSVEDSGIKMFVEKIRLISQLYNKPIRVLFDKDNIYLYPETLAG